jgi:hypothetical protein
MKGRDFETKKATPNLLYFETLSRRSVMRMISIITLSIAVSVGARIEWKRWSIGSTARLRVLRKGGELCWATSGTTVTMRRSSPPPCGYWCSGVTWRAIKPFPNSLIPQQCTTQATVVKCDCSGAEPDIDGKCADILPDWLVRQAPGQPDSCNPVRMKRCRQRLRTLKQQLATGCAGAPAEGSTVQS